LVPKTLQFRGMLDVLLLIALHRAELRRRTELCWGLHRLNCTRRRWLIAAKGRAVLLVVVGRAVLLLLLLRRATPRTRNHCLWVTVVAEDSSFELVPKIFTRAIRSLACNIRGFQVDSTALVKIRIVVDGGGAEWETSSSAGGGGGGGARALLVGAGGGGGARALLQRRRVDHDGGIVTAIAIAAAVGVGMISRVRHVVVLLQQIGGIAVLLL